MKRTALIDGDTIVFAASSSTERPIQWDEWTWTLHGDAAEACGIFDATIKRIREQLDADKVVIALSDSQRWRTAVMPTYKHNRTGGRKPVTYGAVREHVQEHYETFLRPGLEGDDVLGILATSKTLYAGAEKIIVAIDKDMKTIPGLHFNYEKGSSYRDVFTVTQAQADYNHLFQTLTGDVTDGYPGCKGIGPKKAEAILAPYWIGDSFLGSVAWGSVLNTYEAAGLTEADALMNARVARICRASDYNFKTKEVILWNP